MLEIKNGCSIHRLKNEYFPKYTLTDSSHIEFMGEHCAEKYRGCTMISGNFNEFSMGFLIITDDKSVINEFHKLFVENRKRKGGYDA